MIIVKLWGGMCNQMFQYAFGYALSKIYDDELYFDTEFYQNQPSYVGKRAVIGNSEFNLSKMSLCSRPNFVVPFENKYINHLIRYNGGCSCNVFRKGHILIEKYHKYYDTVPFFKGRVNYYDGYWQTSKYFEQFRKGIINEFTPNPIVLAKVNEWKESVGSDNCVAVHIRRGDYLNAINQKSLKDGNVIGDLNYYTKAMDYILEHIDNPTFCFFSDDINWCKDNFSGKYNKTIFVENRGKEAAILDLFSIAKCEHGIMSPSTFSWWGNWLRLNNESSIVICSKGDIGNELFVCQGWIVM